MIKCKKNTYGVLILTLNKISISLQKIFMKKKKKQEKFFFTQIGIKKIFFTSVNSALTKKKKE